MKPATRWPWAHARKVNASQMEVIFSRAQVKSILEPNTDMVWQTIAELGEKQSFHKLLTAGQ